MTLNAGCKNKKKPHQTSIIFSNCAPVLDFSVSVHIHVLVDFSCLKMPIIFVFGQWKCASLCELPYREVISLVSTVSDENKLLDVCIRKFTGVIIVCCFIKNVKINLAVVSILCKNKMLIKYFCKVHVSAYTKLYLFFHWLIRKLFHVKTKMIALTALEAFQSQNGLSYE